MKEPEWLLVSTPREVQLEALRRSFGGFILRRSKDDPGKPRMISGLMGQPAIGWNHYLEMRLGKTPLALNEFELFLRRDIIKRQIVFCPNTYKQGWVDEAVKSGASVPWYAWDSGRSQEAFEFAAKARGEFGIVINYEALKSENTKRFLYMYLNGRAFLVNDESIKLKNHQSQQTKIALSYAKDAGVIRNLSGLPMTQGPHDLYPQLRAIRQLNGLNFYAFRNGYCLMGGFKAKKVVGVKDPTKLSALIDSCSFVAKRKDWGTVSGADYSLERLSMTETQKRHYDEMDRDMVTMLSSGHEITADMVITKLMKLQQISSGFLYVGGGQPEFLEDPAETPKMARLLSMLEETSDKVLIVYHYGASGDALLKVLEKQKPAVIRGAGWMKTHGRNVETEKRRFNTDSSCQAMILQSSAGKYGHDLSGATGNRCTTAIFYENTYSLDDRTQLEARNTAAHQDWTNSYYDFVCSKVEESAIRALRRKESVVESVIGSYRAS